MEMIYVYGMCLLFITGMLVVMLMAPTEDDKEVKEIYQGPVRPTDDLQYFRETGTTKLFEASN